MNNRPALPLIEEYPTRRSTLELFSALAPLKDSFWLDSALDPSKLGRYSLMGCDPFLIFSSRGDNITIEEDGCLMHHVDNPFEALDFYLKQYSIEPGSSDLPCLGGAVGYLAYDLGRSIETLPEKAVADLDLPESRLGFYDTLLVYDHSLEKAWIVSTGFPETAPDARSARAAARLAELKNRLAAAAPPLTSAPLQVAEDSIQRNFTHAGYVEAVEKARRYIIEGDIFEVNLSQRFDAPLPVTPFELYCRLREINPAPFAAFLNGEEAAVVGSSPERFLRLQGDRVETRPIKGTLRRGQDAEEDNAFRRQLEQSEKDRAENIMIVDLERNDLGRVCRYGSIKVTELALLETYPTVFHLTSTVEGQLRPGVSRSDLLKAVFPGGSISGAPKIRAMEIIDELEPTRRGIYTGSLGYFSFDGNLDLNIVIRTFLVKDGRAYFQLGGAVVYDSDPESEYRETLDKGRALFEALTR